MLTIDSYPVPTPTVQGRLLENEAIVVLPEKGQVKVLNEVGARIWSLADGGRSVRDIAAIISTEFAVTPAEAEADTLAFIATLAAKEMVSLSAHRP